MGAEHPYLTLPEISHRKIIKVKSLKGGLNGKKRGELFNEYFLVAFLMSGGEGTCSSRGELEAERELWHPCFPL